MREPPAKVRLLGHPLIATPVFGLCAFILYAWSQNADAWPLGVSAIVAGLWTAKAQDTANQYRRWRTAWDNMGETGARQSPIPRLASAVIAVLVVGGFVLADQGGTAEPAGGGQALVSLAVLSIPLVAIGMLSKRLWARRSRRAGRATKAIPVRVAVTRPAIPVPSLDAAYRSLPEHSQRAMRS